jgi:hypothetical protein
MSSFSCPNFDMQREYCMKLRTDGVPGRPGCVLSGNSVFAVPAEERIRQKEEAKKAQQERQ